MFEEIFIRKVKNGYEAYDRLGHTAFGVTKEIAKNNYRIVYNDPVIVTGQYDMSKIEKKL